jgi:hypothetical protein
MNNFLIDCFFKECCMAQNSFNLLSTMRFWASAMRHCAGLSQALCHIALDNGPALCRIAHDNFVKGTVALDSRDFRPSVFFHESTPYGP